MAKMPPKRGLKRKAPEEALESTDGEPDLAPPDRATWPGWVELESEPAFFNVMIRDMGIKGVKIHEVWSLDEAFLAAIPQPIHALIFLFRYRKEDRLQAPVEKSDMQHIWFANQIPQYACASVALLNIVNNISGLEMGKEMRNFKQLTKDMDPLSRGRMIDHFDFLRQIHNSFARESDLLRVDLQIQAKVDKFKAQQAALKGHVTRKAKTVSGAPLKQLPTNHVNKKAKTVSETPLKQLPTNDVTERAKTASKTPRQRRPTNTSTRSQIVTRASTRVAATNSAATSQDSTPASESTRSLRSTPSKDADPEIEPASTSNSKVKKAAPCKDADTNFKDALKSKVKAKKTISHKTDDLNGNYDPKSKVKAKKATSHKNDDADGDYGPGSKIKSNKTTSAPSISAQTGTSAKSKCIDEPKAPKAPSRRSTRTPKPAPKAAPQPAPKPASRPVQAPKKVKVADEDGPGTGYHYVAYVPIRNHVWMLDGLNSHPTNVGSFAASESADNEGNTGNWIEVVSAAIQGRMAQFEGAEIDFNLMALVQDPAVKDTQDLVENIKSLQAVDEKLDTVDENWSEMEGAETRKDVITHRSAEFNITQEDVDAATLSDTQEAQIVAEDGLMELIALRQRILSRQSLLRGDLRATLASDQADEEKARHRKHDYTKFVRDWLASLAEKETLENFLDGV